MCRHIGISLLIFAALVALGQQQPTTVVDTSGNKTILDIKTGWTVIEKGVVTARLNVNEVTEFCQAYDKLELSGVQPTRTPSFEEGIERCEKWAELQPKTQIEQVPFKTLVRRLLWWTSTSTNFARYRGVQLKSGTDSTKYDAIIVPNDVSEASCTIEERNRGDKGMMYTYKCYVTTASFHAAIQLKNKLVQALSDLQLKEDKVHEHGLAADAGNYGVCAPSGECLGQHVYATAMEDWKFLEIDANPTLTRNAMAENKSIRNGEHAPINGIEVDSGFVSFDVFSVGPQKDH